MTKIKKIAASEARNNFSELVSQVQYQDSVFLIERYGEVVAKLVPVEKVETGLGETVEAQSELAQSAKSKQQGSLAALEKLIRQSKEPADTTRPESTQMAAPPKIPIKRLETEEPVKTEKPEKTEEQAEVKSEPQPALDPSLRPSGLAGVKPVVEVEQNAQPEQKEDDVAQRKAARIEIIRKKIELLMED
jgi:prevent-host-death family protein